MASQIPFPFTAQQPLPPARSAKIVIEHLTLVYSDGRESLRDISLTLPNRAVTVLLGPAGGGARRSLWEAVYRSLEAAALWDEVHDRLDQPAASLSGGQQQRLCLARVLALEPEGILLDEPTSGLDPISNEKVETSLHELKDRYTIVLVPHSVQQAARMADHAAFILDGELVEYAHGREVFVHPRTT